MRTNLKLPRGAKRVFHGKIFDVYQWEQKMFDGSVETFERAFRQDTVSILGVTPQKKILVLTQRQPHWKASSLTLPGGRVDDYERPLAAARRELREETGYTAGRWKLWKSATVSEHMSWTLFNFIAYGCTRVGQPRPDQGEKISVQEYSFEKFLSLATHPRFRERFLQSDLLIAKKDILYRKKLMKLLHI